MSEGTMQRAAQREQRDRRDQREGRGPWAKRPGRVLVSAAAVPVMLLAAAACSSGGSGSGGSAEKTPSGGASASATASASPTVRAAAYGKLPDACKVLSDKTVGALVPDGVKSAKEGTSGDVSTRGSCSWNGLTNNGVKGSQYRWLNVSLLRFASDASRGAGDEQARAYYQKQVQTARTTPGAKGATAAPVSGTGDEATAVRYDLAKKEGTFKQQTVVTRVENVVVTVDYNGAGLAGDKAPDADDLAKSAQQAAQEAVAAVAKANGDTGRSGAPAAPGKPSGAPSDKSSGKPSDKPSGKPASPSASTPASPSETAADS
ncbi:DUF3558 domain-containing protein [Streptomyces sp. NPDC047017]|uniref:DUF3558 domain-containing protein n=1 Tax=Streptomyces sp. NPDC047017 TaxID=3155024 RepID=UPI003409195B